ncbi:FACTOR putative-RELATED [Salix purpurea]|uniref:FACTOR putative-RELATED n=1 Tax=Salix purpurea TaxID=77065 RepID=A0A9Q0PE07_SALPP|nr:FACTOR putative-RELATED [Salix purpurea]
MQRWRSHQMIKCCTSFCPRDCKYPNSQRVNRTTKAGYWKSTGRDRKIKARRTKKEIGTKKTLVFHEGRVPDGIKTNWIIHEYRSQTILPHQEKGDGNTDTQACDEGETSNKRPTNLGNPVKSPIQQVDQERQVESVVTGNRLVFRCPPAMQQQVHEEQGLSFENTPFANGTGYGYNEFDTDEEEVDPVKFADSFLDEPPDDSSGNTFSISQPESDYEETPNTLLYNCNPPVIKGYLQSGTTAQCSMGTSNLSAGYAGADACH